MDWMAYKLRTLTVDDGDSASVSDVAEGVGILVDSKTITVQCIYDKTFTSVSLTDSEGSC